MKQPRVLIDGFYIGAPSGYGRAALELCRALSGRSTDFEIFVALPSRAAAEAVSALPNLKPIVLPRLPFPLWEQIFVPMCAANFGCSLVHFPYNTRAVWVGARGSVTTVHDLTFLLAGAQRTFKSKLIHLYMASAFALGTKRSGCLIAVSETTRQALAERNLPSRRIYNTVDGFLAGHRPTAATKLSRPYFLHRGSYQGGHRNTDRVIRAFLNTPELVRRCDLYLLGVPDGAAHWHTPPTVPVRYLPRVSDLELAALYRDSAGVVAPSLLEGFCLPIVEAFGFAVPVITSSINPMQEIAGDAALLVPPDDDRALADAMLRIVCDTRLAADLVERGTQRLKCFASDTMARQVLDVYDDVISERRVRHRLSPKLDERATRPGQPPQARRP